MSDSQGRFVWYELMTSDVAAARKFYGDVIGWGTQAFAGGDKPYVIWQVGTTGVGGLMTIPEEARGAPSHWVAYVAVDDVDRMTERAVALGGKVCHPPTDIPTVGRFSVFADPQGAVLAMIKPQGPDMPRPATPPDGHFSWRELMAANQESALEFYAKLLGWQKTEAVASPMGTYQMFGKGGETYGGMMTCPQGYPVPPRWLYYVKVGDLDGALARVKQGGGQVLHGPMEIPGGERVAQCQDPQGAAFALHGK